jgi:hypothetical protein
MDWLMEGAAWAFIVLVLMIASYQAGRQAEREGWHRKDD